MLKALFVMTNPEYAKEWLVKNDIEHQEWFDKNNDEYEIRVDLSNLQPFEIDMLKEEFDVVEPIDKYDYLILW